MTLTGYAGISMLLGHMLPESFQVLRRSQRTAWWRSMSIQTILPAG
jgi:hypothetical protein